MKSDKIILDLPYTPASRQRSWVSAEQVEVEHWEVVNKICDILFSGEYSEIAISFARNILAFLIDWEFITWKQYDSIMNTKKIPTRTYQSNCQRKMQTLPFALYYTPFDIDVFVDPVKLDKMKRKLSML